MLSKISFFNPGIFKKTLKRTWVIGFVYFIVAVIIMPVLYILNIYNTYDTSALKYDQYFVESITFMNPGVWLAIFQFVIMMFSFGYLFLKRDTYMMHAFPVSRKSLYFTNLVSTIVVMLVPSFLITVIMSIIGIAVGVSYVSTIWFWLFEQICVMVFFTGFSAIVIMITGQAITACFFYAVLNVVFVGMEFAIKYFASEVCFGLSELINNISFNMLTPVAYITSKCGVRLDVNYNYEMGKLAGLEVSQNGLKELIIYLIVGILFIIGAYVLYQKKQIETVHDFITVKFVKPIYTIGMSFFIAIVLATGTVQTIISTVGGSYWSEVIWIIVLTVVYGAILFFVMLMLVDKNVRVFKKNNYIYCAVYSVAAVCLLLLVRGDVAGVEKKIPSADEIEWAGIGGRYEYVFRDAEDIESLMNIHESIIDNKAEIRDLGYLINSDVVGTRFTIKYKLKNDKLITRNYYLKDETAVGSVEYVRMVSDMFKYLNEPERIKEHVIGPYYDQVEVTGVEFSKVSVNEEHEGFKVDYVNPEFLTADDKANAYMKIYKAFLKDVDAGAILQSNTRSYANNENDYYNDFSITLSAPEAYFSDTNVFHGWADEKEKKGNYYLILNENCTNTIAALKETGFITSDDELIKNGDIWGSDVSVMY